MKNKQENPQVMKVIYSLVATFLCLCFIQISTAQKVGIGTSTPEGGVDVVGQGNGPTTMNIRGSFLTSSFHRSALENTRINGGKVGSRVVINETGGGKVGIGTSLPGFLLNFSNTLGDKISLWGNTGPHYGFGIQPFLMQFHTDMPSADIVLGYGSSTAFTENLRIRGNGNVGIGVNDPVFKLDVGGRMRIRSGGGFSTAGLYLNNNNNTSMPAFIGMDDDTHVGFWGSGVGWRFSMNTQTGALKVNGSEGSNGQVLVSAGGGQPQWGAPLSSAYQMTTMLTQSSTVIIVDLGPKTPIPGLSHTFTASTNTKVVMDVNLHLVTNCNCNITEVYIDFELDGGLAARSYRHIRSPRVTNFPATALINVPPGSHTLRVTASVLGVNSVVEFRGGEAFSGRMTLLMIPG